MSEPQPDGPAPVSREDVEAARERLQQVDEILREAMAEDDRLAAETDDQP
jgi:hypothetical protein